MIGEAENAASFGAQWAMFDPDRDRTWGADRDARLAMFQADFGIDTVTGLRILDAGCGHGVLTGRLAAAGADAVGLEVSGAVEEARQRYPTATFVQGDVMAPPNELGRFDLVYSGGVLHHTPDTRAALAALVPLIKQGGAMYVWLYHEVDSPVYRLKRRLRHGPLWWRRLLATPFAVQGWLRDRSLSFREHRLIQHDFFTPRWRWEHTPDEVIGWMGDLGAHEAVLRSSSRDGFGILARF